MKKPEINFDSLPRSAVSTTHLNICLKCTFNFFTRQLKLTPRAAYAELKKHVPDLSDFTGASTSRPHFLDSGSVTHCPYCRAPKKWFGSFRAYRIDAHPTFEKERKKLWAALKKKPDRYTLWTPQRTQLQIFSEWLERLNREINFNDDRWLLDVALEAIKRATPAAAWEAALTGGVRRVQLSRQEEGPWRYETSWLFVGPALYGDVLIVQHLLSRSHTHGGRTFEGRLTLQELMGRLRRSGYFDVRGIGSRDPFEAFEEAVSTLVASGPAAVYYAVDRNDYLKKLKSIYEEKRAK
ncbi:MAG TPA: hypothetical protein VJH03_03255 [Blastocatellia bacterium]|nr:hypothetical protein [Blastocatellia bacterium]